MDTFRLGRWWFRRWQGSQDCGRINLLVVEFDGRILYVNSTVMVIIDQNQSRPVIILNE